MTIDELKQPFTEKVEQKQNDCNWCGSKKHNIEDCRCSDIDNFFGDDPITIGHLIRYEKKQFKLGQDYEKVSDEWIVNKMDKAKSEETQRIIKIIDNALKTLEDFLSRLGEDILRCKNLETKGILTSMKCGYIGEYERLSEIKSKILKGESK